MQTVDEFKQKYAPVFALIGKGGVRLDHLHVQDGKLVMSGAAASEDLVNQVWNAIKAVDAGYSDLAVEITVDTSLPAPASASAPVPAEQTYTVVAGDTLSKIAQHFYGKASDYPKIAAFNGIDNPDRIRAGQVLRIPA